MKLLIFGRGMITMEKYIKYIIQAYCKGKKYSEIGIYFVDKQRKDCFGVGTWENESRIPVDEIKKVLILSTPTAHLSNFNSIVNKFASSSLPFPEIYIEKPIYLESEKGSWRKTLNNNSLLNEKVFYIDHYRFKDQIDFFCKERANILNLLGKIMEIAFVSLEKQEFWDSSAFSCGYFLEHGCHFFGMLDRAFPEIGKCNFVPYNVSKWRSWAQFGRPAKCGKDSAALLHLQITGLENSMFSSLKNVTIITGKGMIDKKFFYIKGEKGCCQIFFNENKTIIKTSTFEKTVIQKDAKDSYERVVEDIFSSEKNQSFLMPLESGISDQEKVIEVWNILPQNTGTYYCGEIPNEIERELLRIEVGG